MLSEVFLAVLWVSFPAGYCAFDQAEGLTFTGIVNFYILFDLFDDRIGLSF